MKSRRTIYAALAAILPTLVVLLLLVGPALAQTPPVIFPPGPWPGYAQPEITVHPDPPIAHQPTKICAEVVNLNSAPQNVHIEFSVANFGIGVPFMPVGTTGVVVPPNSTAQGCVVWVPPNPGHWCIQARLIIPQFLDQISQRNFDIWEDLIPGKTHPMTFQVGPLAQAGTVTFTARTLLPNWGVRLDKTEIPNAQQGGTYSVTLSTTPPQGDLMGSGEPVADVEGFLNGQLLGGFRKLDWPPIHLHRPGEPFYAESEISVRPYPPQAGEPTRLGVKLRNISGVTRTVEVQFSIANFGIGLPFRPVHAPIRAEIPPHGIKTVHTMWVPPFGGHFCVQVSMQIVDTNVQYQVQFSQRNLDVSEVFDPGKPTTLRFPVGNFLNQFTNANPQTHTIFLTRTVHLPGWKVDLSTDKLDMQPFQTKMVEMTVTPPADWKSFPKNDFEPIVDVEAYFMAGNDRHVIGGFRKIFRPPVPIHRPDEPPYGESEISVVPYPPRSGEPTKICTWVRNDTNFTQTVQVEFGIANYGVGIPFVPVGTPISVELPPHSQKQVCVGYVFSHGGHFCVQIRIHVPNYPDVYSQRNLDVAEVFRPHQRERFDVPIGNPYTYPVTITLGLINQRAGWEMSLSPSVLTNVAPGELRPVTVQVTPSLDVPDLEDDTPILDLEAYVAGKLIGGIRKVFRPPVPIHRPDDPQYAEREITIDPYPVRAGEPAKICVELRNPTDVPQTVNVQFLWAHFGIGLPFQPIGGPHAVIIQPHDIIKDCVNWVPPVGGRVGIKVEIQVENYRKQWSLRNMDVGEPLRPDVPHSLPFPVRNPNPDNSPPATITLGLVPHMPDWQFRLSPTDTLTNMQPGETRFVTLTTRPRANLSLLKDDAPVVDVEGHINGVLIGGFRKVYRPPVPIHRPEDPVYAESEITVHPYPPRAHEPTELGVELRNTTDHEQTITVTFGYANFGIGLPFQDINDPMTVTVPAHGTAHPSIVWLPPRGGHWCIRVKLESPESDQPFISQRNMDVGEPLQPGMPHSRTFLVGNPTTETVTVTLGLIPHLPDWGLSLSPTDTLPNMQPGDTQAVTLTVVPPQGRPLPKDGTTIVDVEGYAGENLIGGFRKIYRPPVPIHRPKDPVYAESEIGVDPYPVIPGQPVKLSVEVHNPTNVGRIVTATFSIARFGIGLPFTTTHIAPNPIRIFVPAHGAAVGHVVWMPPSWRGHFCVRVTLEMEGHEPVWSQRNIDVGEPLRPGQPHSLTFPVGVWPYTDAMTVTLGLVPHRDGWDMSLSKTELPNVPPGQPVSVTLTVTPSQNARLGTGEPIVDVEGFINGEIIGGFRKIDRPPIPLHKPHEKDYAESEINVDPYPPQVGQPAYVSTVVQNAGSQTGTVTLEFGWAKFGMGIPFTTTGMTPPTQTLTLSPGITTTASVTWTPTYSGSQCILVKLTDQSGYYDPQLSRRNVRVVEQPPCGETQVYTFTVKNDSPFTATVEVGVSTLDVPSDWVVTTNPTETLTLAPYGEGVVTVTVEIPCPITFAAARARNEILALQAEAGSTPTIDVEGYVNGEKVGGIELQLPPAAATTQKYIYLPLIMKSSS